MTDREKKEEIGKILLVIAEMYDKQFSTLLASQYIEALISYDLEVIQDAANYLVKNHSFSYMPRPAQFIEACKTAESVRLSNLHKLLETPIERPGDPEYGKLFCRMTAKALKAGRTDMDKIVEEINETYSRKKKAKSLLPQVMENKDA